MRLFISFASLLVILHVLEGQKTFASDSDQFTIRQGHMLWAKSVFKLSRASVDQCAKECLSMRGRCLSFDYNKRFQSCFGRSHGAEVLRRQNRPHIRRNSRYDFYATTMEQVNAALRVQSSGPRRRPRPERPVSPNRPQIPAPVRILPSPTTRRTARPTTTREKSTTTTPRRSDICHQSIGLEDGRIPDDAFSASTQYSTYKPWAARLNGDNTWMAYERDYDQYLEINLGRETAVKAIGTQGFFYIFRHNYVSHYKIQYQNRRTRGRFLTYQEIPGKDKVFEGNADANSEVINTFTNLPFTASRIRIVPTDWYNNIVIRAEIYTTC